MAVDVKVMSGTAHPDPDNLTLWTPPTQAMEVGWHFQGRGALTLSTWGALSTTDMTVSRFSLIADALSGMVLTTDDARRLREILADQRVAASGPTNVMHLDDVPEIYDPGNAPE